MKHSLFKRAISMLITVAMLLTMVPSVFAANLNQFVDFPKGWSKTAMEFSVANGLINGKSANKIEPQANLTRAEMATIINRAFGAEITTDISSYTDVNTSDWFYAEMQKAVNMQTFLGDGNGKLRPNDAITREEVMAVIARAIVLETNDYSSISKYKDYSKVSDWAKPYVASLISNGYVNGYEDNTVKPNANITREEFAQLMYNIFKTYLTVSGTTYNSVYKQNCVMINNKNINLSNVIVYGDLVLGDGVGTSKINLTNVTINGRLVARGGIITLKNVTTGKGVVVKNVNGTTLFNNYRTDAVFNGVAEHTYTTYLTPSFVTGGGNRPGAPSKDKDKLNITVKYYYRDEASGEFLIDDDKTITNKQVYPQTEYSIVAQPKDGYKFSHGKYTVGGTTTNFDKEDFKLIIEKDTTFEVMYEKYYTVSIKRPGSALVDNLEINYNTKLVDIHKAAYGDVSDNILEYTTPDNYTFNIEWYIGGEWIKNGNEYVNKSGKITYKPIAIIDDVDYGYVREQDGFDNVKLTNLKSYADSDTYTYSFDKLIKNHPVKERKYYTFDGWKTQYGDVTDTSKVKYSHAYYVAKWIAKTPDISFDLGNIGATFKVQPDSTYSCDKTYTLPVESDIDFDKTKYTFEGWYENAEFKGDAVTKIDAHTSNEAKKFYAYFLPIDTTVKHSIKFYANAFGTVDSKGLNRAKYVGKIEDVVHGSLLAYDNDSFIQKINSLYLEITEEDDDQVYQYDLLSTDTKLNKYYGMAKKGFVDKETGITHIIYPELVYKSDNGKWLVFNHKTPVTSDMEVYAVSKYVDFDLLGGLLGKDFSTLPGGGVKLGTPYNSTVRLMDSLKDAMYISREKFRIADEELNIWKSMLEKIAPKAKIIDEDGYIKNFEFSMKIADVIKTSDIEKEIRKYIDGVFRGDDVQLKEIVDTIGVEKLVRNIGIKNLVENIGYSEVRNALKEPSNRNRLLPYIRQLLKTDKPFRNMLVGNREFMDSVLKQMKSEIIDSIVADTDFIIDILKKSQTVKNEFVESAVNNNKFLKNVLSIHKDEIVDLIHNEEKAELISLLDNETVKSQITQRLKNDSNFMNKLDNDEEFKDFVVDAIHDSVDLSAMFDDDTIDAMLDELQGNADFEEFKKDIIKTVNTDSFKKEVISSVKNNKSVVTTIVNELSADENFKKTLIGKLSENADLRTTLVNAATSSDTTKKQIVEKIALEASFKKEILGEISADISDFSKKIVNNIKDQPEFKENIIDNVIIVENNAPVRNDALNNMIDSLKNNSYIIEYTKDKAQAIINAQVPVNAPQVTDDEAKAIIYAYINDNYDIQIGGYDVDVSDIEADIDEYIVGMADDYKNYVSGVAGPYSTPVDAIDNHINDVVASYLDGSDDTLKNDIEGYVQDIVDAYNDDNTDHALENEIDTYIDDAVNGYVNGSGSEYADVIDDYITDIKTNYNPAATTGIDGKINEYIVGAINEYASGVSNNLTAEIDDYINDAISNFNANDTTGVNGVINTNINNIINGYVSGTDDTYKTYIDDYIDGVVDDFVNGNTINADIKSYIDSHMKEYVRESIEKYSNKDDSLEQKVYDYIDKQLPEFLFDHIKSYFHGTLNNNALKSTIEDVITDFVKKYINDDPSLTNEDVKHLIKDNIVDYIIDQLTTTDDSQPDSVKQFVTHTKEKFVEKLKTEDISEYSEYSDYIRKYIETESADVKTLINDNYDSIVDFVLDNITDEYINNYIHKIIVDKADSIDEGLINNFLDGNIDDVISDDFIKKYIDTHGEDEELINMVLNYLTSDKIVKYVNTIEQKDKENNTNELGKLVDKAIEVFKDMDFYKSLIKCLDSKSATYKVTNENIFFMDAIGKAIGERSFEDALVLLGNDQISDVLIKLDEMTNGDISSMYYESVQSFSKGLEDVKAKIEQDSTYTEYYPMSLWLDVHFASIIDKYYTKLHDKVQSMLETKTPYYYNQNKYIKQFVANISIDTYLGYDASKVSENNSGYYIKSLMEYYDIMYDNIVLLDKAILWYGADAPDELLNLRDDIANDVLGLINKIQSILAGLDEGGELVKGYTLKDIIGRVESLKQLGDKVPVDAIETLVDNICSILSKLENGEVIAKGYTMDDLVELSERLDTAIKAIRDEDYDKIDKELGSVINKVVSKVDEVIKELDTDGTILGKISLDELAGKFEVVNNIYKKFEDKIDAVISKLASMNPGNVGDKVDTEYWEDVIFGTDYENRFNLDDVFDLSAKVLDKIRDKNPEFDGSIYVIDPYKVSAGSTTVKITRYMK